MTKPFSTATQAVLDVVLNEAASLSEQQQARVDAAATLRAAAKQSTFADTAVNRTEEVVLVSELLAIAAELEEVS